MILHHSLLSSSIQTKQFDLKTITISKLPVDIMTHSITLFIHTLIQIFKRIAIKTFPKITVIPTGEHNIHIPIRYQRMLHKLAFLHQVKEYHILTWYSLFKDNFKILRFHIYIYRSIISNEPKIILQSHSDFTTCIYGANRSSFTSIYTTTTEYNHKYFSFNTRICETFRRVGSFSYPRRIFTTS